MSIDGIKLNLTQLQGIPSVQPQEQTPKASGTGNSFAQIFDSAIREVDDLQKTADNQIEGLALGADGVTPHGAMLALEKADMAFQLMSTIRAKILRAYEEVIRTQV